MVTEPPPSPWVFPPADQWPVDDLVAVGAELDPGTVLAAYRHGLFPMHIDRRRLGWWSPIRRGVLPLDELRVPRSLARSCRRYRVTIDTAFREVMARCATTRTDGNWITPGFLATYAELHEMGWCHSVETWLGEELVGGLYGVHVGGLFAGESMFSTATDASKVALVGLVENLRRRDVALLDTQWATPHLKSLGVVEIDRTQYLDRLAIALDMPATWEGT